MMSQRVKDLIVKDGKLFKVAGSTPTPCMNTLDIEIVGKRGAEPDPGRPTLWRYSFAMNASTDDTWDELFYKNFSLTRQVAPQISGEEMLLMCEPVSLKSRYVAVKDAIGKANRDYKLAREDLIRRVLQAQQLEEAEAKRKTESEQKIREQFENLEI